MDQANFSITDSYNLSGIQKSGLFSILITHIFIMDLPNFRSPVISIKYSPFRLYTKLFYKCLLKLLLNWYKEVKIL